MSVEWGCRLICDHPGCQKTADKWSKKGTPALFDHGYHLSGPANRWFIFHRGIGRGNLAPLDYSRGHLAYCPDHAYLALAWWQDFEAWRAARQRNKTSSYTWKERFEGFFNAEAAQQSFRIRMRELDSRWLKANPAPKPPWK